MSGSSNVVSRPPDSAPLSSFSPPEPSVGPAPHQPANWEALGGSQLDGAHPACFASSRLHPRGCSLVFHPEFVASAGRRVGLTGATLPNPQEPLTSVTSALCLLALENVPCLPRELFGVVLVILPVCLSRGCHLAPCPLPASPGVDPRLCRPSPMPLHASLLRVSLSQRFLELTDAF